MPNDSITATAKGIGALKPWRPFADQHFPMPPGRVRSNRSYNHLAKKHGFELLRIGHNFFIDEEAEAERLREELRTRRIDRQPRRPGRPRKAASS